MGRLRVLLRRRMAVRTAAVKGSAERSGSGRRILRVTVLLVLCAAVFLVYTVMSSMRTVTRDLALSRISYLAGKVINDTINEVVAQGGAEYADLIDLDTDATGSVSALRTNMVSINRLKSEVTSLIIERINALDSSELAIPMGSLLPNELFSGRGPAIPVVLIPVGSVDAELESVMVTAGINQTRHSLVLRVSVYIGALLPGFSTGTEVCSSVSVAETVIVGKVPNAYTYLEDTGQSGMDIYGSFELEGEDAERYSGED